MASIKIIDSSCQAPGCEMRATREVVGENGDSAGFFCARHGDQTLRQLTKAEWNAQHRSAASRK